MDILYFILSAGSVSGLILVYFFIIKPQQDEKAASRKKHTSWEEIDRLFLEADPFNKP
jgi:preprotein translocase subunit YajC